MDEGKRVVTSLDDKDDKVELKADEADSGFVPIPKSIAADTNAFLEYLGFEPATQEEIDRVDADVSRIMEELGLKD